MRAEGAVGAWRDVRTRRCHNVPSPLVGEGQGGG
jgi:hypothetical protein